MRRKKAGIEYEIQVGYDSRPLGAFRKDADLARKSMDSLRASAGKELRVGANVEKLRSYTDALKKSSSATKKQSTSTQNLTRQQQAQIRGLRDLDRASRKREARRAGAIRSQRQEFRLQRQAMSQQEARVVAEKKLTDIQDKRLVKQQLLVAADKRGLTQYKEIRKQLGLLTQQEKNLDAIQRKRVSSQQRLAQAQSLASDKRARAVIAEAKALERINQAEIKRQTNQILTSRGRADLITGTKGGPDKQVGLFKRLASAIGSAENQANRASFTFRRLFGILAAFTVARNVISGFQAIVRTLVITSAEIEKIELGIASLLSAVGDVRDLDGGSVEGVEALTIAQQEARKQTQLLRADALLTTATFEELAEAFQVGLAPGLDAGLDVDQVRQFTVQISQAAAAIGLEQRQLAEEIRSILSGNISKRNTRIATALGIEPQDIKRASEAGELFEFLSKRFNAFSVAGERAAQTFLGMAQRIVDASKLILEAGGVQFFEELKTAMSETIDLFIQLEEETGTVRPNDELVRSVAIVSEGLRFAVAEARRLRDTLLSGDTQGFAIALASGIRLLSAAISGLIEGAVKGVSDLQIGFLVIAKVIKDITGLDLLDTETLRQTAAILTRLATIALGIVTILGAWKIAFAAVLIIIGPIQTGLSAILFTIGLVNKANLLMVAALVKGVAVYTAVSLKAAATVAAAWIAANLPVSLVVAGIVAILVGVGVLANETRKWLSELTGVELKFGTLVKIIKTTFVGVLTRAILRLDFGIRKVVQAARVSFFELKGFVVDTSTAIVETLLSILSRVSSTAERSLEVIQQKRKDDLKASKEEIRREEQKLKLLEEQLKTSLEIQDQQERRAFNQAVEENDQVKTVQQTLVDPLLNPIKDGVAGLKLTFDKFVDDSVGSFTKGIDGLVGTADDGFSEVEGFVVSTSNAVKGLSEQLANVNDELIRASIAADNRGPEGLSGIAKQISEETARAATEFAAQVRKLAKEEELLLNSIKKQRELLENIDSSDLEKRRRLQGQLVILEEQIATIRSDRAVAEAKSLAISSARIANLTREANFSEALSLTERQIEVSKDTQIALAERARDFGQVRLLQAEKELQLLEAKGAAEQTQLGINLSFLNQRLQKERELLDTILAQQEVYGQTDTLLAAQQLSEQAISELEKRIELLTLKKDLEQESLESQREELEIQRQIAEASKEAPVQAGIFAAAYEKLIELSDVFKQTQKVIGSAIASFARTASSLIVDIFDPGKDASIRERFARFLQGIAQQILTTLISLATTAIVLNSLSGGILGPLIKGLNLGSGLGFAEGGRMDRSTRRKAVAHPAHFARPQGRHRGGTSRRRPKGLHPSDTIPIWVAQNEWVVKASSVFKAGHDAMSRINAGHFDPEALRSAVGLGNTPVSRAVDMSSSASGKGFVSGGRVRQTKATGSRPVSSPQVVTAVVPATEQTVRRLLSGPGSAAMLEFVQDNAEEINARLDRI